LDIAVCSISRSNSSGLLNNIVPVSVLIIEKCGQIYKHQRL
jgi:hypothetical protein